MRAVALKAWSRVNDIDLQDLKESDLISMSLKGDPSAFGELVKRHEHGVYNLSYRYMRDSALAEDMAQEAFLKGFRLFLHGCIGSLAVSALPNWPAASVKAKSN